MNNSIMKSHATGLYKEYANDLLIGNHFVSDKRLQDFVADLAREGLLLESFKWDEWYNNSYMVDRPEYIADATLYECQLLVTAMARLDRFSPGVLSNMRRQGVLNAIAKRFKVLSFEAVM
ncbi:hypothetical protein JK628_10155 [Shewanella sp. KX20019]|uniref:DUF6508 domain-containing protein n=1 Tax=Shewanella sp. KX20019 TaxID=2803864 RepID=UPI0019265E96|nr:DUF6508 domain-containing protein [Shewanella sp. KX20019]QQX82133.1 hypothetical protein JK628_10155 [Shewanella sp. KX20019]